MITINLDINTPLNIDIHNVAMDALLQAEEPDYSILFSHKAIVNKSN